MIFSGIKIRMSRSVLALAIFLLLPFTALALQCYIGDDYGGIDWGRELACYSNNTNSSTTTNTTSPNTTVDTSNCINPGNMPIKQADGRYYATCGNTGSNYCIKVKGSQCFNFLLSVVVLSKIKLSSRQ